MSNSSRCGAARVAERVCVLLAIFLVGCASSTPDEGRPPTAEPPDSDAAAGDPARSEASLDDTIELFVGHYRERLGVVEANRRAIPGGEEITLSSPLLKGPGNEPQILVHAGGPTEDVIVLCHGLSDSPHYMRAVGDRFFAAGANVVLPLLPAHGLVDPDEAMEDRDLARQWIAAFVHAVNVAETLGGRISLGGFSTGGALSVYEALREPERIDGGLFLFAAALSVGSVNENLSWSLFLIPRLAKRMDGHYEGRGPNPYKYPKFPQYGGIELVEIIHEINRMIDESGGPRQPIFAVHSVHDASAMPEGVGKLLRADGVRGVGIAIASNPPLEHARLTLAEDIALDPAYVREGETPPVPRAFPAFERMMDMAVHFLKQLPQNVATPEQASGSQQ